MPQRDSADDTAAVVVVVVDDVDRFGVGVRAGDLSSAIE